MAEMVKMATRESFGKALAEFADQYPDVIVLDADLASARRAFSRRPTRIVSSTAAFRSAT